MYVVCSFISAKQNSLHLNMCKIEYGIVYVVYIKSIACIDRIGMQNRDYYRFYSIKGIYNLYLTLSENVTENVANKTICCS